MSVEDYVVWLHQLPDDAFDIVVENIRQVDPEEVKLAIEALERFKATTLPTPMPRPALRVDTSCIERSDDSVSAFDDATLVGLTPISTAALDDVAPAKKVSKKNKLPCGACQARKKKCIPVSSTPRLCELCQRSKVHQCPPHVSGQAVRDVYNSGVSPKKASSSQKPDEDGFIYEYTAELQ